MGTIYTYTSAAVPDIDFTLDITPQNVVTEITELNQKTYVGDDGSTIPITLSTDKAFFVILQWSVLSDLDAATIWDCWIDKAMGYIYSFKWEHPTDGHVYVVRFDTPVERSLFSGNVRSIKECRLRVEGWVS